MDLSRVTFRGPALADSALLSELPSDYARTLIDVNGFVAFDGGFHLRGVCDQPAWHSLAAAWTGEHSVHRLFPSVRSSDLPFGEDCMGDQFVLREGLVHKLASETGELSSLGLSWQTFFDSLCHDSFAFLQLHPLVQFQRDGGRLEPGQILSAYPPFAFKEAANGVSLAAVPIDQHIHFLSDLARQLSRMAGGDRLRIVVSK